MICLYNLKNIKLFSSNVPKNKILSFKEFSPEIFKSICPLSAPNSSVLNPEFSIIRNLDKRLKYPMIGVDIKSYCDLIMSNVKDPNGARPMFATVAGFGKGKTRLCVEIDKYLRENYGVSANNPKYCIVSIPITFNSNW